MSEGNILEYKGYHGKVDISIEDKCLHGKILGINALVTFESDEINTIEQAFKESVDDYLDLCERNNLTPEKEYDGVFTVRVQPETHRKLALIAESRGERLNTVANAALLHYVKDIETHIDNFNYTINPDYPQV